MLTQAQSVTKVRCLWGEHSILQRMAEHSVLERVAEHSVNEYFAKHSVLQHSVWIFLETITIAWVFEIGD